MESSGAVVLGAHHSFERVSILIYPGNRAAGIIRDGSADERHKKTLEQPEFVLTSRAVFFCVEATFRYRSSEKELVGKFVHS